MLNDPLISALEKAVSGSAMRHQAILNNISNVNTANYKRVDVNFKSSLAEVLNNSSTSKTPELIDKIEKLQPDVMTEENTSLRNDGNNVDIDTEMSLLAKNSMEYENYISLLSKKLSIIKTVVNEGRK